MSNIRIEIADIETMDTDYVVNAANEGLWEQAIKGCAKWTKDNPDYDIDIVFAIRKENIKKKGEEMLD